MIVTHACTLTKMNEMSVLTLRIYFSSTCKKAKKPIFRGEGQA